MGNRQTGNPKTPQLRDVFEEFSFYTATRLRDERLEAMRMRIVLADDRPKTRYALRQLLARQPGLEVVGEATSAGELVAHLEAACPDLVLLDWELPGLTRDGSPVAQLRRLCPGLRVVILSGDIGAREVALAAGADAYVSKTNPPERLLAAIEKERTK
jgi:DNA-binding NarL/FixJ family response regulator